MLFMYLKDGYHRVFENFKILFIYSWLTCRFGYFWKLLVIYYSVILELDYTNFAVIKQLYHLYIHVQDKYNKTEYIKKKVQNDFESAIYYIKN